MNKILFFKKKSLTHFFSLMAMAALGFFITVALVSYRAHDPSWFFISTHAAKIHNIAGAWGAQCAAVLLFLFGSGALLIGPGLMAGAYFLVYRSFKNEWDRCAAFVALIISVAGIEQVYGISFVRHGFSAGGAFGLMVCHGLRTIFDPTIAAIFLHVVLIISLVLLVRLSFVTIMSFGWAGIGAARFLSTVAVQVAQRIAAWAISLKRLFDGSLVEGSSPSIVEFESDESFGDELKQVLEDPIWSNYGLSCAVRDQEVKRADEKSVEMVDSQLDISEDVSVKAYRLPSMDIFKKQERISSTDLQEQEALARVLEEKLLRFGIEGKVVSIRKGPVITLFEYQPHIDSKISKIIALEDDLALALQAMSIRIIAPIPGRAVVGFEVANKEREHVLLGTILHAKEFNAFSGSLPLVIGVDTVGKAVIADLVTMPHMLIAGATGSGKSVELNAMLITLLYRCTPDELNLILIDPKRLEFAPYADIPHLIFPIVTNAREVAPILQWVIHTMEERYEKMAALGVRSIIDYNKVCCKEGNQKKLPFIVVMIDELSDVMMVAGKDIEERITRIAQMARAAGIHLVVATQRPSVDVITGIIKANFPSRISFKVATKIDSRTILDAIGADKLLGKGDMLYLNTSSHIARMHGAYVSDKEIEQVTACLRSGRKAQYHELPHELPTGIADFAEIDKELYHNVIAYIQSIDEISISLLQRRFRIGYNRSARVIDRLEAEGLIMPSQGGKTRKVIRS